MKKLLALLLALAIIPLSAEIHKVGLVLSGGGARCLAQIGVLKVLDEYGIPVDCIAGTSMGAVIGGLYAAGYSGEQIEQIFTSSDWSKMFNDRVTRQSLQTSEKRWGPMSNYDFDMPELFSPRLPKGIVSGERVILELSNLLYGVSYPQDFNNLRIPFRAVATDIVNGQAVVFSEGSLPEVLRASLSFPSFFMPFTIDDTLYVDGGVLDNFPVDAAKKMDADYIIGVKTNTELHAESQLVDIIDVLDQSLNVNMTRNVENGCAKADLVMTPPLESISNRDFKNAAKIIAIGEQYARDNLAQLLSVKGQTTSRILHPTPELLPDKIQFYRIEVQGNQWISASRIRRIVGLDKDTPYTRDQILQAFRDAYCSDLFRLIYPEIRKRGGIYAMVIKVEEKDRAKLGVNARYNETDNEIVGASVTLNNYLLRNSKLILNCDLGGKQEFDLDLVKNFGQWWGGYYHMFHYTKEERNYFYNDDHEKIRSTLALEYGGTLGMGAFAMQYGVIEGFLYSYNRRYYHDISQEEIDSNKFYSSGYGVKFYHESLNDPFFPMSGSQVLVKFNEASKKVFSDASYHKLYTRIRVCLPFAGRYSVLTRLEYGTFFEKRDIDFDATSIGGIDNFMGFLRNEYSAPFFRTAELALRIKLGSRFFIDLVGNTTSFGNADYLGNTHWAEGLRVGYNTFLGPIRAGIGIHPDRTPVGYLSIGYDLDAFEFSRR